MAASTFSPGGFSYAQAAKGRTSAATSQTPSSKVTSGTATPATGTFSELTPGSNWADDVETSVKDKKDESPQTHQEEGKTSQPKDAAVERAKAEEKQHDDISAGSSPDITATSSSTTKDDDMSLAPNATSSESTWDTKSQTSEPAWCAERSHRQNGAHQSDRATKSEQKGHDASSPVTAAPPKPVVLQEAPPPENFWAKRAAEARAKVTPKPATSSLPPSISVVKENQKPATDARTKPVSSSSTNTQPHKDTTDDSSKASGPPPKRAYDTRNANPRHPKPVSDSNRSDAPLTVETKVTSKEQSTLSKPSPPPPSVTDEVSWPTPDTAEKDRKESVDKEQIEKRDEEAAPVTKRKWQHYAITPKYLYETTGTSDPWTRKPKPANGERPPRASNGVRGGRGGRGGMNGGDRHASRSDSSPTREQTEISSSTHGAVDNRDADSMPPPSRPTRAASAGATQDRRKEGPAERTSRAQSGTQTQQTNLSNGTTATTNGNFTKPSAEMRRTRSPKRMDSESNDELPKPIPRRNSGSTPAENVQENAQKNSRNGPPPVRMVLSDNRKEQRNFGENRDGTFPGPSRGAKRNGRGRGGARELANGHPGPSYAASFPAEFNPASPYVVPQSPSGFHSPRGNHQFSFPASNRGSWRGNPRSQSIPIDTMYNQRFGGAYNGAQQVPPYMQSFLPGMYDPNGYPMSAIPYPGYLEQQQQFSAVIMQVDYYFSEENLYGDNFLRQHMDSQGFVLLDTIASFKRVRLITEDKEVIKICCMSSEIVEIRVGDDGKERLRKRVNWDKWVYPMEQRASIAQNDGPKQHHAPERPQLVTNNLPPQFRGPASAGLPFTHQRFDRRSYDSGFPMMDPYAPQLHGYGGFGEATYGGVPNGEEVRGRSVKSPAHESVASPPQQPPATAAPSERNVAEADSFPDEQMLVLTVVVRMGEQRASYHSAASRTFSNGSIDSRSALPEIDATTTSNKPKHLANGDSHLNGGSDDGSNLSRHASPSKASSSDRGSGNTDVNNVFWVKEQEYPVDSLPPGLNSYPYPQLREEALQQRGEARTGTCPAKLTILYEFWCHFLIRNFNSIMYSEFKRLANEDAGDRYNFVGLNNLVKFYAQSLSSQNLLRDTVAKDYVELVESEPVDLQRAAFNSLRSAWRNGALNLKNRKKLSNVLPEQLKEQLDKLDT